MKVRFLKIPDGCLVGVDEGCRDGWELGWRVGCLVGVDEGCRDGWELGRRVGCPIRW